MLLYKIQLLLCHMNRVPNEFNEEERFEYFESCDGPEDQLVSYQTVPIKAWVNA
jgi:hypothetical protein